MKKEKVKNKVALAYAPKQRKKRSTLIFALSFFIGVCILWLIWGRPYFGNNVQVEISNSINIEDSRIDYAELEKMAKKVNEQLLLPGKIVFSLEPCNESNAYYDIGTARIVVCDELIDDFNDTFSQLYTSPEDIQEASTHALVFIALHEFGHALIDILNIPFTGKEEDAADQLSTYLLMNLFEDGGQYVLDGATWFGITSEQYELEEEDFIGEHSLDAQRYYSLACWVYGADSDRYGAVILDGGLSPLRAESCLDEYYRISSNWDRLLKNHLK